MGMTSSVAPRLSAANDVARPVRAEHRAALADARLRSAPAISRLADAIRSAPDADLDRVLPAAMRELDLLWQALGRVTQP